ncbi:MAG: NUDIX hydrolase [Actinomycetota bacterium]
MGDKTKEIKQYAALAYRMEDGHPMVVLVTSRETKRWILPKGQPEARRKPFEVAAQEAYEEAGLVGAVSTKPFAEVASYKRLKDGREVPTRLTIYLMQVDKQLDEWPEMHQRERRWVAPGEAALMVDEPGLVEALLEFGAAFL